MYCTALLSPYKKRLTGFHDDDDDDAHLSMVINGTGEPVRRLQHASHSAIDQDRIRPVADTLDTLFCVFFSALTLSDGQRKGRLACKVGSNY